MARVISFARQLRFELQAKLGREVTIEEVAEAIGVDRRAVMAIERNEVERINRRNIEALANYYVDQGLDGTRVMEIVIETMQKNGAPRLGSALQPV